MIPFDNNVVYIQIENGDQFGDLDLVASIREARCQLKDMLQNNADCTINLVRYFTVQALQDTLLMKMNLSNMHKM